MMAKVFNCSSEIIFGLVCAEFASQLLLKPSYLLFWNVFNCLTFKFEISLKLRITRDPPISEIHYTILYYEVIIIYTIVETLHIIFVIVILSCPA